MKLEIVPAPAKTKRDHDALVEPIFKRQPHESDRDFQLFLIYRDLPYFERTLKNVSIKATGDKTLTNAHSEVVDASKKWQWKARCDAFELYVQEHISDRQERVVLELKSEIEVFCLNIMRKVKRIEAIEDVEDMNDPSLMRDLKIVEGLIGKAEAGKFLLNAYKTVIGEKLQLSQGKLEPIKWASIETAA